MVDNRSISDNSTPVPASNAPKPEFQPGTQSDPGSTPSRKAPIGLIIGVVLVIAILITGTVLLLRADNNTTARVRDVFIIFMALESLVIGAALVILVVQLATLINLLNNEIRPIINSTNETVNTIKGTVTFLSDNLSEPVIKLNEYLAAVRKFFEIVGISKR
jgi:predicted PurR-regulated permease PerM